MNKFIINEVFIVAILTDGCVLSILYPILQPITTLNLLAFDWSFLQQSFHTMPTCPF